jgi:hypothetical protein
MGGPSFFFFREDITQRQNCNCLDKGKNMIMSQRMGLNTMKKLTDRQSRNVTWTLTPGQVVLCSFIV